MNLLAFFAHPDDETMLAGGLLALLATLDVNVHILCATRGEGGDPGEPPFERSKLGAVRAAELACAAKVLGAGSLTFLNYIDPLVGPEDALFPFTDDEKTLAGEFAEQILLKNARILLTHGSNGEYGHPAHQIIYRAAKLAVENIGDKRELLWYTVQAGYSDHPRPHLMNPDDAAHWILDVRPVLHKKVAAARCHKTQNPLFFRRVSEMLGRPIIFDEVALDSESYHRVVPPVNGKMEDALIGRLASTGLLRWVGD